MSKDNMNRSHIIHILYIVSAFIQLQLKRKMWVPIRRCKEKKSKINHIILQGGSQGLLYQLLSKSWWSFWIRRCFTQC